MKTRLILLLLSLLELAWSLAPGHQNPNQVVITDFERVTKYEPNWESLDKRPIPPWYDSSKFGIFVHWGVFSVPAYGNEWFWNSWKGGNPDYVKHMEDNYSPKFTYQDFGPQFTAQFYDPAKWANLFQKAGAKYVVLVSKHHEGFTLWPSKYSFSWNAQDVGPKRDLVGELAEAVREKTDLHFGLYHSMYEWFNPLWLSDKENNFTTDEFVRFKIFPSLIEIVNKYKPDVIWPDGEWEALDTYWNSAQFIAWLYNESPVKSSVVINDRWGSNTRCKHGGFYTCSDNYNPGVLQPKKWENCMPLDKNSWGYRQNANIEDYQTPDVLIKTLIETVSCGGNLLLNVGPTKEGLIVPVQEERLLQIGEWLGINGDAIYDSVPWKHQNDTVNPTVWYTYNPKRNLIYALAVSWPGEQLQMAAVDSRTVSSVSILGCSNAIQWSRSASDGITVTFPREDQVSSRWAWVVAIEPKSSQIE